MYPPQTSLIPATVSLIRYFSIFGFAAFFQNYPNWYLGTTPFKYLIGPVVPLLEVAIKSLFNVSLLSISTYLVIFFAILSGVGWVLLIKKFFSSDHVFFRPIFYLLPFTFYLLLPWKYLSGLAISELTSFIAFCLLPFVLLTFGRKIWLSSLAVAILMLVSTNVITSLIVGAVSLAVSRSLLNGKIKKPEKRIKKYLLSIFVGIIISTLWYGPRFWLIQIVNPGIGGGSIGQVLMRLLDFVRGLLPLVLAVIVVYFKSKFTSKLKVFAWIFFGSFAILTIFRFVANPAFWMDWTSWLTELEVGAFLILANNLQFKIYNLQSISKILILIIFSWVVILFTYNVLGKPQLISTKPPEIISSLSKLAQVSGKNRVFVTGSSVFWLNVYFDTVQVRGGRDEVSIDPDWRLGAYNFREGVNPIIIDQDLKKLNVVYVLVNATGSSDFYKDYKNLSVWPQVGVAVAEIGEDTIYKVR